jgi:hypothetical protein
VAQKRKSAFQISYVTITYRSVLMGMLGVLLLAGVVLYFAFPDTANKLILSGQIGLGKALAKMGVVNGANGGGPGTEPGPQQAHFTNIDGNVRVRKSSTNTWLIADYSLALERGDVVQTSPEGLAKVVFTDGTNYTVKPNSLITIQENSVNASQQTKVSVQVTTGRVDLATSAQKSGSSQVIVNDATATLASDTSAEVVNDQRADQKEILIRNGSADVARGGQTIPLERYTKVSFSDKSKEMTKTKVLEPPTLISPAPSQNVFLDPSAKGLNFTWAPVDNVKQYHMKISRTASFLGPLIVDNPTPATQVLVTDLQEGNYYWQVRSIGPDGKESIDSETYKFTIVPKGTGSLALEINDFTQMGHVIEVKGKTEPGARVMVNGAEAVVGGDGAFHHFTNPLPTGENLITITAQDAKGGVNTVTKQVVIQ